LLTLLADRLLVGTGTCGGGKGATTTASSVQQLEKQCLLEIVIDTGITYNKSGVADPNPVSGVSLTPEGGSVKAKNTNSG
jgi:hypothetical protein